jgi:ribosomal protein S18 acetylase RimI-like enzyme
MGTIDFRPATADDFEFFFHLHKQSLGPYVEQVWGWVDDDQRAYLQRTIDIAATQVIVVDGVDVGRLNLAHHGGDVYIGLIEIAPTHQRRGIGGRILGGVLDDAFTRGEGVRLSVLAVNDGAHRLYRRLGFIEVGREGTAPKLRIHMRAHQLAAGG